ncbi:MAG: DUF374 domain-containing protein [Alphaproteobacteria bacterium]|nr:DUF374 domain-containing protein [Alphaproteobacteria bacterium]
MSVVKRWLRSDAALAGLSALLAAYIRLVRWTGRWQVVNAEAAARIWSSGKPIVGCFWHGRMMMMTYIWATELPIAMLISRHRDGRLIARTIERLGIMTIAGSTAKAGAKGGGTKGGASALLTAVRTLKSGVAVAITPDGPRGPRMRASPGAVAAARLAGVPLVPVAVSMSRRKVIGSWDRFLLALPFSRGVYMWGDPISVPEDADAATLARITRQLESELTRLCDEADRLVGCAPIEPAPALDERPPAMVTADAVRQP